MLVSLKNNLNLQMRCEDNNTANQTAQDLVHTIVSTFLNVLFDKVIQSIVDYIHQNRQIRSAETAWNLNSQTLKVVESLFFPDDVSTSLDNIFAQVHNLMKCLYGELSKANSISCLLIGPPGIGKTSILRKIYQEIEKCANSYYKKTILNNLTDSERNKILSMRKKAKNKNLVYPFFIPGSFFEKFGDYKLNVFDAFIKRVKDLLKDGYVVFLGIDEVDALIYSGKFKRSPLGTQFLFGLDELNNVIDKEGYPGKLVIVCTTNGGDFDFAMVRRITRDIITFNHADAPTQIKIFNDKFKATLKQEIILTNNSDKLKFDLENILSSLNKSVNTFIKYGVNFTGAEIDNIVKNFFSSLDGLSSEKLLLYGEDLNEQTLNLFKFFMLKEALKVLKIQQHQFSKDVQKTLNSIAKQINLIKSVPMIDAGCDWNTV